MKKLILISSVVCFTVCSLIFVSCYKNNSKECKTCTESINYSKRTINIEGNNYIFKTYQDEAKSSSFSIASSNNSSRIFEDFIRLKLIPEEGDNLGEIISVNFFTNQVLNNNEKVNIKSIDNLVLYYKKGTITNVSIFFKNNEKWNKYDSGNLETYRISSNDIVAINNKILPSPKSNCYSIIDFSKLSSNYSKNSTLQFWLNLPSKTTRKPDGGGGGGGSLCNPPCHSSNDAACTAQESQSGGEHWFCVPTKGPDCAAKNSQNILIESNPEFSNSSFSSTNISLYNFRDNYLGHTIKGQQLIDAYYYISSHLNYTNFTIAFCLNTFDLIVNEIIPPINILLSNPNSNSVPISPDSKIIIINYLNQVKTFTNDADSLTLLDMVANYVTLFEGKTCAFITNYLTN
jgi:hypothetical protein